MQQSCSRTDCFRVVNMTAAYPSRHDSSGWRLCPELLTSWRLQASQTAADRDAPHMV